MGPQVMKSTLIALAAVAALTAPAAAFAAPAPAPLDASAIAAANAQLDALDKRITRLEDILSLIHI